MNTEHLKRDLALVRAQSPLVHNITNYVAMNFSANALLAIGASPVMAHAVEEMDDMVSIASALVINIGTLDAEWVRGMLRAGRAAHRLGKPIVLDPVGAGATPYRTQTAWEIIRECQPTIIRGNASEIMALVNSDIKSKGVDSSQSSDDAVEAARQLAQSTGAVVVISGATDYITDGTRTETVTYGSPLMTRVTAMGCTASSMVGAFAGINPDPFEASLHAMMVMSICGERAAAMKAAPGSLLTNFVDTLYTITPEQLGEHITKNQHSWSDEAFAAVADIMHSIAQYEFIQQMLDGTLRQEQFVRYLQQDKLYLKEYSRDLYAVADMMTDKAEGDFFRAMAKEGMESENAMQAMLSERFGITGEPLPVATTVRYTSFLRHYTDTLDLPVVLAAVLPCYWVYNEVGKYLIAQHISPDNPYREWIQTYGSPEMDEATRYVVALIDRLADSCTPEKQALMRRIFAEGCALELEFFMIGLQEA